MVTASVRIGFELPFQIACVQSGQPGRARAVPASLQPMAGEAGVARARPGAAERDDLAILPEAIKRCGIRGGAPGKQGGEGGKKMIAHPVATVRLACLFPALALALAACKPAPDQRHFMPQADAAHGKAVIARVGCGSCHAIPGVRWPQGTVGPALKGLAGRGLIAGKLPNEPDVLAAYIRNAPALVPGSAMPAMPVSAAESRDVAAYLYQVGGN